MCAAFATVVYSMFFWRGVAKAIESKFTNLKKKIKQQNVVEIDLGLATTAQIFKELSKRGKIILLIPHSKNSVVETFSAQLSPTQTMDVLRVAYTGIAGHLEGGGEIIDEDYEEDDDNI